MIIGPHGPPRFIILDTPLPLLLFILAALTSAYLL